MKPRSLLLLILSFLIVQPLYAESEPAPPNRVSRAPSTMVVTADPAATQAAIEILEAGGNAVDAAIAAQWVLNVVEPESSGIGGGGFFLFYDSNVKAVYSFDGREKAPRRVTPEMFLDPSGPPFPFYPDRITGGLPVGVPGTLLLLKKVHERFGSGKLKFEDLFVPAIRIAEEGFPVSRHLAAAIQEESKRLKLFDEPQKIFFHPDGSPLKEGEILIQKDLGKTFETIAIKGIGIFYEGEIAQAIVDTVKSAPFHPGLMELSDLKFYQVKEREALHVNYRGYDVFTMGPPSSGGVALIEILNILENFSLIFYGPSANSYHLAIEAQKIAFGDRADFLADPDFVKMPIEKLISKEYAKKKAREIQFDHAKSTSSFVDEASLTFQGNTSHISIQDSAGNIVSYTTTIEHIFGSGIIVPGWGFFLNNELTDFDAEPRIHPDLKESRTQNLKPNAPGPEKRPRSSMSPVIVFHEGKPFLTAGSPGGSLIIPTVHEILMNVIDFRKPLEEAVAMPRFAARGGEVEAEAQFIKGNNPLMEELKKRGHQIRSRSPFGNAEAIFFDEEEGTLVGVSDPRGEGEAAGY